MRSPVQAAEDAERLGHLERAVVRQHHAAAADADALGDRRDLGDQDLRARRSRASACRGARRPSSANTRARRPAARGRRCSGAPVAPVPPSAIGDWSSTLSRSAISARAWAGAGARAGTARARPRCPRPARRRRAAARTDRAATRGRAGSLGVARREDLLGLRGSVIRPTAAVAMPASRRIAAANGTW